MYRGIKEIPVPENKPTKGPKKVTHYIYDPKNVYKIGKGVKIKGIDESNTVPHWPNKPYTAELSGQFGQSPLFVNVRELMNGNLIVDKREEDGKDSRVIELKGLGERRGVRQYPLIYYLVTRGGTKILKSGIFPAKEIEKSVNAFRKLAKMAKLLPRKGEKFNLIYGKSAREDNVGYSVEFIPYGNPDDLVEMLTVIQGSIGAGNQDSGLLKIKKQAIIEELARIGAIDSEQMTKLIQ